ncbi:MAG: hypothetical protein ACK5NK_04680 [Niabella sp.]
MKKVVIVVVAFIAVVVVLASCMKDNTPNCINNTLAQDQSVIDSFLTVTPSLNYISFNSTYNLFLGTEDVGSGSTPASDSIIVFKRETRLLNGTLLDSATVTTNPNTGMPLKLSDYQNTSVDYHIFTQLMEGGSTKLIVPSSLNGLGCSSGTWRYATSPGNSQIISTVTLIDVKNNQ